MWCLNTWNCFDSERKASMRDRLVRFLLAPVGEGIFMTTYYGI